MHDDAEVHLTGDGLEPAHQLAKYFELTGYEVPAVFGPGRTGDNIKKVEKRPSPGGFPSLTPARQAAWLEILGHNLHDCVGLRRVVIDASCGLASLGHRTALSSAGMNV